MRIAVLYSQRTDLKDLYTQDWEGRDSDEDAESVIKALNELGHETQSYDLDEKLFQNLLTDKKKIDLIFNLGDEGFFDNAALEPHVPAMLDLIGIPYTGGNHFTLSITLHKHITKILLSAAGIKTPGFQVFNKINEKTNPNLTFPLIVKPLKEDGSIGIKDDSIVKNEQDLKIRVEYVLKQYKQPALAEEFIDGREFNVGIIGDTKKEVLPVSEISFEGMPKNKPKIVSYNAKWDEKSVEYKNTNRICPAKISDELKKQLETIAIKAGETVGARDYFRVDFRVNQKNVPYVLEINQNPDISEDAGLAAMAKAKGYEYKILIDKILKSAIERK